MKEKYFDRIIANDYIKIKVSAKVSRFLKEDKKRLKEERKQEKENISLEKLMEKGFQPVENTSIEQEIARRNREQKYLNSKEYKEFLFSLRKEIKNTMHIMPKMVRMSMFLRFFKGYSISKIAKALGIAKSTAQSYLAEGCGYLKYFLDKDIKQQDKLERQRRMKIEQEKYENHFSKND